MTTLPQLSPPDLATGVEDRTGTTPKMTERRPR